jgi:hypothetical protein
MRKIIAEFFGSKVINYGPAGKPSVDFAKIEQQLDRAADRLKAHAKPTKAPSAEYKPVSQDLDTLIKLVALGRGITYPQAYTELQERLPDVFNALGYGR